MSRFVRPDRIAITEAGEVDPKAVPDGVDVIFVRSRMDFGTRQRVITRALKVSGAAGVAAQVDAGDFQLALAQENIVDWAGPGFEGRPCNAATIAALDPADPLLTAALNAISRLNPGDASPKA
jgi:hypothetical protein